MVSEASSAETLEYRAQPIDDPPAAMAETLGGAGPGDAVGRTHWEAPLTAPFRAARVAGALFHTQRGLSVNANTALLRDGRPIPGLLAGMAEGANA